MKDNDDPSYASELARLAPWDRSFWLSRAYLEAACCLCANMVEGTFSPQYSSSRVILHLARQGIELFFKAAIQGAGHSTERLGHNLHALFIEYRASYPGGQFQVQLPSRFLVNSTKDLFQETLDEFHRTLDQRHRYATDRSGQSFASPEVFDPVATRNELEELQQVLGSLEYGHIRPELKRHVP